MPETLDITAGDLTFREPAGVAIGKDDMIYVSDTNEEQHKRKKTGESSRYLIRMGRMQECLPPLSTPNLTCR